MCVIIASNSQSKRPSLETLRACEAQNPHGGGVAFIEKGEVFFKKGIGAAAMHRLFKTVKGPMVAHFRWATVGGINDKLCHPFIVSRTSPLGIEGYARTVLFHNGTWESRNVQLSEAGLPSKLKGLTSDSRLAATMVHDQGIGAIAEMEGRYCVMTKDGFRLHNNGWTKRNGVWFSNMRWYISRPVIGLHERARRPAKGKGVASPDGKKNGAKRKQGRKRGAATAAEILGCSEQDVFDLIMEEHPRADEMKWPD